MQCPSCRNDIPDNQFYCPICRASVYSYVPENMRTTNSRVERAGKRLLEALLFLILIGIGVVLARAIKWNELLSGILPGATSSTPKPESSSGSSGKRGSSNSSKASEGKPADAVKSASTENAGDKKPTEAPSSSETNPAPKPVVPPTPKPPAATSN